MSRRKPKKHEREIERLAGQYGLVRDGFTGSGHLRFRHPRSGRVVVTSESPSDWRTMRNTVRWFKQASQLK